MHKITKIIAVINNYETLDAVLSKAVRFSNEQNAQLEILYVHEEALFKLPEYFRFKEIAPNQPIDKEKLQKEIAQKLADLGVEENTPILIFIDDTADHVLVQTKDEKEAMIVISYHKKIAKDLIKRSHLPVLIVKNNTTDDYKNVIVPVDFSPISKKSIVLAKALFPKKDIELVHDYRYLINEEYMDPEGLSITYENFELDDIEKKANKRELEALAQKMQLKGSFITQDSTLEKDLLHFIQNNSFDLAVIGSNNADNLFFGSVSFDLMEIMPIDLLIYAPQVP